MEEFPKLIQQLNEYGDQNLIETTRKLYGVLKGTTILEPEIMPAFAPR